MTNRTIIVKPNTKTEQYGNLKYLSAIEPPIWHAVLAEYYQAMVIIDAEVEDLTVEDTIQEIVSYEPSKVIILATGSHPSAFIQQKDGMIKLELRLEKRHIPVEAYAHLHIDPLIYEPRWDLLDLNKYRAHNWHSWTNESITQPYGVTYTSISCPFHCSFCTIHQFYGSQFKLREISNIINDFDVLAKAGVKNIKLMDELFIFNKERVHKICDAIIERGYDFNIWAYARIDIMDRPLLEKMRKAGIRWLAYGIEAGNDTIRKEALKGNFTKNKIKEVIQMTKDYDICIIGNFMFGFWEDTLDTMQETLDLAIELNCEYINFYCIVAYPNTPFYKEIAEKGISLPTDYNQYAQTGEDFKPLPTNHLTAKQVLEFRDKAFLDYFTGNEYLSSIEQKIGDKVLTQIHEMVNIPLIRNGK